MFYETNLKLSEILKLNIKILLIKIQWLCFLESFYKI